MEINSRLPDIGISIFTVMAKMALDCGAINLSQGFPDFPVDEKIISLINKYMIQGNNQYAPMQGVPALRQSIATMLLKSYNIKADPEKEITVTSGATEGIFSAISAFITPGDEVIVFDPAYDSYEPSVRLNGGLPVQINLHFPDFSIDWDEVKKRITRRTKMIIVNNPHNPSGSVLGEADLLELERLALSNDLLVIGDEVYDRLIYDGAPHRSVLSLPGLASRSLAVFSFGKMFHATGWKMGYVVASPLLTQEVRKTHQFIVFSVNTPIQWALAEHLGIPDHYLKLSAFYQQKRDFFLREMQGSSFEPLSCHGSYFQLMSYKNVADKPDVEMAETLTRDFKVACIPVSVFYKDKTDNRILRFCFAKKEETLASACEVLRKL